MSRALALAYGVVSYVVFFLTFLYAIGFVGDFAVPKTIDRGGLELPLGQALLIDVLLLGLFAVQHSGMARQGFKRWWNRIVPRAIERSTYVLVSSLVLILMFWLWVPIDATVWEVTHPVGEALIWGLFALGWVIVLISTFLISHFDLFGLRQVWLHWKSREYRPLPFVKRGLYQFVRHPIMLGFLVAFWATPHMTAGHLLFAFMTTGYILVGVWLEEKDLVRFHGRAYEEYREEVSMILPLPSSKPGEEERPREA